MFLNNFSLKAINNTLEMLSNADKDGSIILTLIKLKELGHQSRI